jgi:hydrogenase nickel incorporation protein HypA/HybF
VHELSITEGIVATLCERVGESRVHRVVLEIGRISGVVPDALRFCFDVCAAGTPVEGAVLEIREIPGVAWCPSCQRHFAIEFPLGLCGCGSTELEIVGGRELRIKEVEVAG